MQKELEFSASSSRICTLAFDEMSVSESVGYWSKTDQIIGPHQKMQLVSIRGIVSSWKMPIYFNFDFKFTPDTLFQLIKDIHKAGLCVKGNNLYHFTIFIVLELILITLLSSNGK